MRPLYKWCIALSLAILCISAFGSDLAQASHFRYGNISWAPTANAGEVLFRFTAAFRRSSYGGSAGDGMPQTGDIITESVGATGFNFGDATSTGTLRFVVTSFSVSEDWINGEALQPLTNNPGLLHTYAGAGPYTAGINTCCRIGNVNNRSNGTYILQTTVRPTTGNRSPVTSLVPIISVPQGAASTFTVPASDPDGDPITFRISTDAEAGGGSSPPGISINSTTGLVTWNNLALNTTNFWTVQVIIEDRDGSTTGAVKTQTPVDFLLRISQSVGTAPTCTINPANDPLFVSVGSVSFTVTGNDVDAGSTVEINSGGLPSGATMSPSLPVSGAPPLSSVFNWTPTPADAGSSHSIFFTVTDNNGLQSQCSKTIIITSDWRLPVELSAFTLSSNKERVNLMWQTASEVDNAGFELYRSDEYDAENYRLIASYVSDASLKGLGTSSTGKRYTYVDNDGLKPGAIYRYKLVDVSTEGLRTDKAVKQVRVDASNDEAVITAVKLHQIAPNPVTNEAAISFTLQEQGLVTIEVFANDGRLIGAPVKGRAYSAGSHTETVITDGLPAGSYMVVLTTGTQVRTQRFVVVR